MTRPTVSLALLAALALPFAAVAQDVGQHPAVFAPRALPGVDPSTFIVGHPAAPRFVAGHANHEHPAVTAHDAAPELDTAATSCSRRPARAGSPPPRRRRS